ASGVGKIVERSEILVEAADQRVELSILAAQGSEAVLVVLNRRFGKQGGNFFESLGEMVEFLANGWFHVLAIFELKKFSGGSNQVVPLMDACLSDLDTGNVDQFVGKQIR